MKKCILAVGACYFDTVLTVDHYPCEDEKLRALSHFRRRGGNCPNTLEVLQQFIERNSRDPLALVLCTVLPSTTSSAVAQITSSLGANVDLSHCIYRQAYEEPAVSYILRSHQNDSRTIVNYSDLPEMTSDEFTTVADALGEDMSWCHFEGRIPDVTLKCMRYLRAKSPHVKISVEVEKPGRVGLAEMASEADVVFYSKIWAQASGFDDPEKFLRNQAALVPKASLLSCTWGGSGAAAIEVRSLRYSNCPSYPLDGKKVVDAIGAGDTFMAGMLYSLNYHEEDWDLYQKLKFSNELAGRKIVQEGFADLAKQMHYAA